MRAEIRFLPKSTPVVIKPPIVKLSIKYLSLLFAISPNKTPELAILLPKISLLYQILLLLYVDKVVRNLSSLIDRLLNILK